MTALPSSHETSEIQSPAPSVTVRYQGKTVAVVVPCFNEEVQITKVIETMPEFVDRIVIVDDKSSDHTSEVVRKYQEINERITLLVHESNQGVGGAIATGYKWCRDNHYDIAVVMAGDGQMDPGDLPALLEPVIKGEVDYAKGNRLFTGEAYRVIPKIRYFGNSVLSFLTKIASGYWHVADSQTGYTAMNKKVLETVDWDRMYRHYGQPNDLLVKLNVYSFRVRDVPIRPVYNVGEKSRLRVWRVVFPISWLLFRLFFWRLKEKYVIKDFHPLVFFYFLSFFILAANIGLLVRLIALWSAQGQAPELTLMAWMFSLVLGLQSMFFAMWFDMEANKHLK